MVRSSQAGLWQCHHFALRFWSPDPILESITIRLPERFIYTSVFFVTTHISLSLSLSIYIYIYMERYIYICPRVQGSWSPPSPPKGRVLSLGSDFLTQIDDFSKESLSRISSRDICLWRSSWARIPFWSRSFFNGFLAPERILGEQVAKHIDISRFAWHVDDVTKLRTIIRFQLDVSSRYSHNPSPHGGKGELLMQDDARIIPNHLNPPNPTGGEGGTLPGGGEGVPPNPGTYIYIYIYICGTLA